jgi:two-component system, NarL family, sensor histidine kinase DegS
MAFKRSVIENNRSLSREMKVRVNGKWFSYIFMAEPTHDRRGEVDGLIAAVVDVSEQRKLEAQQIEAATNMEVQRRLLEHREMERQEIAREIHDGPIQSLVSTIFEIQFVKEGFPGEPVQEILDGISSHLRGSVRELREVCNELRPNALIRFGLTKAIRTHANDFMERFPDLELTLDLLEEEDGLPEHIRQALYRIYQEALSNVVRHASATQARVGFNSQAGQTVLEISDNGQGFSDTLDWVKLARESHFGLVGIKERTEAIGGTLQISSSPETGTTVKVLVPTDHV